jgi:hypothetical protein
MDEFVFTLTVPVRGRGAFAGSAAATEAPLLVAVLSNQGYGFRGLFDRS